MPELGSSDSGVCVLGGGGSTNCRSVHCFKISCDVSVCRNVLNYTFLTCSS